MKKVLLSGSIITAILLLFTKTSTAQCVAGEVSASITINTDAYAKEAYWQVVPLGFACNNATVGSGGNTVVGCNGGGQQNSPAGGYANNSTNNSATWCLIEGASYDLISVDDWGDGGTQFTVNINGYPVYNFSSVAATERFTFVANGPLAYDMGVTGIITSGSVFTGTHQIKGILKNFSSNTINSLTLNYSINNGTAVSDNLSGLGIAPFTEYSFIHSTSWTTPDTGEFILKVWATNLNGNADLNLLNDEGTKTIVVLPPIPNLIDQYLDSVLVLTPIATSSNSISVPRDLDFHPDFRRYELWVILKSTEANGGKTVIIQNAGKPNQTSQLKQDGNAYHFMSLPTAIAFSDNENFATSPGVYDANHDGGSPFTGPALWSSDLSVYAQPSGGNGSHLDMLHESPYSMGICHEKDNVFWVMDGDADNVVRYDFETPHEAGGSDHSNGVIWRYSDVTFQHDPVYHVPSHCVLDKNTNMLYMVDFGGKRVQKMDITTGTPGTSLTPHEATAEYRNYDNPTQSVVIDTGLNKPCGIEVFANRLLVSDYANGDIRIYDISNNNTVYLGKIVTGAAGIMGIKIGPDGKIWYVNATQNKVFRIDGPVAPVVSGVKNEMPDNFSVSIFPNPNSGHFNIQLPATVNSAEIEILNLLGEKLWSAKSANQNVMTVNENLSKGMYLLKVSSEGKTAVRNFVIQ